MKEEKDTKIRKITKQLYKLEGIVPNRVLHG